MELLNPFKFLDHESFKVGIHLSYEYFTDIESTLGNENFGMLFLGKDNKNHIKGSSGPPRATRRMYITTRFLYWMQMDASLKLLIQ